jgi:hypothetical protein
MDTGQGANWAAGGRPVPGIAVSALVAADNTHQRRTDMGKIIVSENVTLDGVVQDPAGDEGFRHGGWVGRIGGPGREEVARVALEEALAPRPCCWAGAATSSSARGGLPGPAPWRTG